MANYDGSIRIKVDMQTADYERTIGELKRESSALTDEMKELSKQKLNTSNVYDMITAWTQLRGRLQAVAEQAQALSTRFKGMGNVRLAIDTRDIDLGLTRARHMYINLVEQLEAEGIDISVDYPQFSSDINRVREEYNDLIADLSDTELSFPDLDNLDLPDFSSSNSSASELSGIISGISGKLGGIVSIVQTTIDLFGKLLELSDYMVNKIAEAYNSVKKFGKAIKDIASGIGGIGNFFYEFSKDALSALGITEELSEAVGGIGFGDLVSADLLADAIRELAVSLKDLATESVDMGKDFVSYYQNIERVFKDSADAMYEYAQAATKTLGLSETAYMKSASSFGTFLKGYIEADSKALAEMSNGMAQLVADYAAAYQNYSQDEIYHKLLSGLRGETEAIEDIGLSVKAVDMQRFLDKKGIDETWESLDSVSQTMYRVEMFFEKAKEQEIWGIASSRTQTFAGQLTYLNAQFENLKTTMGAYLMQVLTPVLSLLNQIIARVIDVVNAFGKFFGLQDKYAYAQGTEIVGVPDSVTEGYENAQNAVSGLASSEEDLAKATEKSAKAAKKALAPFHKLNVLQNKDSGSSGSSTPSAGVGGAGSLLDLNSAIEPVEPDEPINLWLEELKKAIAEARWEDAGVLLGEKINSIIESLDFTKYRDKLHKGVLSLAGIINGMVKTIDFNLLGVKIGQGIDTIVSTINLFLDSVNFENVGVGLSKFFKGLLSATDWKAVGKLWSQKTRVLLDIVHGFVKDMSVLDITNMSGWEHLGEAFSNFVSGVLDLEWERLGSDIGLALNGISDVVTTFIAEFDMEGIASRIVNGINNIFTKLEPKKVVSAISSVFNEIVSTLYTVVTTLKWSEIGSTVGELIFSTLANFDWEGSADTITSIADGLLNLVLSAVGKFSEHYDEIFAGLQSFANGIISWINDPDNQDKIASAVNDFTNRLIGLVGAIDWTALYEGISESLSKIDWGNIVYLLHLGDGIMTSLKSIFGTEVLSGVVESALGFIGQLFAELAQGLLKGLSGLVALASTILLGIPAMLIGLVMQIGASLIDGLIEGITGKESNLRDKVDGLIKGVIDFVKELFGIHSPSKVFSEIGSFLIEGLVNGVSDTWSKITSFFSSSITALVSSVTSGFNTLKTNVTNVFSTLVSSVTTVWTNLKTSVVNTVSSMKESLTSTIGNIKTSVTGAFENIKTSVSGVISNLRTSVEGAFTTMKTNIGNIFGGIKSTVVEVFSSLGSALKSPINTIISFIESMANAIINGINSAIGSLNKLQIDVPDGVPVIGGKQFGFSVPTLNNVKIPRLADGAVIKPNQRFLAELGDQTKGINIETPLETMLNAFRGALAEGGYGSDENLTIPVYIGTDLIEEIVVDANKRATYRNNGR